MNPTTPMINAYRDILYYKRIPELNTLLAAVILGVVALVIGYTVFGKLQKGFAEQF